MSLPAAALAALLRVVLVPRHRSCALLFAAVDLSRCFVWMGRCGLPFGAARSRWWAFERRMRACAPPPPRYVALAHCTVGRWRRPWPVAQQQGGAR